MHGAGRAQHMSEELKTDADGRHYNHADREAHLDPTALVKRAIEEGREDDA
jgi:hypothetical protein